MIIMPLLQCTPEDIAHLKQTVARWMSSDHMVDKITGLLIDIDVGGHGMPENAAYQKAKAIMNLVCGTDLPVYGSCSAMARAEQEQRVTGRVSDPTQRCVKWETEAQAAHKTLVREYVTWRANNPDKYCLAVFGKDQLETFDTRAEAFRRMYVLQRTDTGYSAAIDHADAHGLLCGGISVERDRGTL